MVTNLVIYLSTDHMTVGGARLPFTTVVITLVLLEQPSAIMELVLQLYFEDLEVIVIPVERSPPSSFPPSSFDS